MGLMGLMGAMISIPPTNPDNPELNWWSRVTTTNCKVIKHLAFFAAFYPATTSETSNLMQKKHNTALLVLYWCGFDGVGVCELRRRDGAFQARWSSRRLGRPTSREEDVCLWFMSKAASRGLTNLCVCLAWSSANVAAYLRGLGDLDRDDFRRALRASPLAVSL